MGRLMVDKIDAILLASGDSKRFGPANKLLWPFRGMALAERALLLVCGIADLARVHFVYADASLDALAMKYPVLPVHNANSGRGICESVRLGVASSAADYYLFVHCDQPMLDAATIETVLSLRRPGCIVTPYWQGNPGNPSLFSAHFRRELLELADGESPRIIRRRHPERVVEARLQRSLPLRDVDTREDMEFFEILPPTSQEPSTPESDPEGCPCK